MDSQVFKSKVDVWLAALLFGSVGVIFAGAGLPALLGAPTSIAALGIPALVAALLCWIYFGTYYKIGNGRLMIRSAFIRIAMDVAAIISVRPSRSPLSGPALSLDRLEVRYRRGSRETLVLISPAEKDEFMDRLQEWDKGLLREGNELRRR